MADRAVVEELVKTATALANGILVRSDISPVNPIVELAWAVVAALKPFEEERGRQAGRH